MTYKGYGRVIRGVGGLFTVRTQAKQGASGESLPLDGKTVVARGRGALHRKGALLVGDLVEIGYDHTSFREESGEILPATDGAGISIDRICDRRSALIRPPMANLDVLFITLAAATPDPVLDTVDKLISIAEFNRIEPVVVITKSELAPAKAEQIAALYRKAGFETFCVGFGMEDSLEALRHYVDNSLQGKVAAFSGASGVGKSTLMNRLFPQLGLETGEISHRIERGKNTTRRVELYTVEGMENAYIADTPGFSMLDFVRFDFFTRDDLVNTMREFEPYIGECRYTKCSHTKEQGCAILAAMKEGRIAKSRHESYVAMYEALKNKHEWSKK